MSDDLKKLLRWSSREGYEPGARILMVTMNHPTRGRLDYNYRVDPRQIDLLLRPIEWLWAIVLMMQDVMMRTIKEPA